MITAHPGVKKSFIVTPREDATITIYQKYRSGANKMFTCSAFNAWNLLELGIGEP